MFKKEVDTTNRENMITFLKNHFRYATMNSWNQSTSYANDVKLYNLDLPKDLENKAYDVICDEIDMSYYNDKINKIMTEFTDETGYAMGYNGRQSGYLVLYNTEYNINSKTISVYPGRSIDQNKDFEDWSVEMLKDRVKLVTTFDEYCDKIRDEFINMLKTCEIKTKEKTVTVTYKILEPIE